MLALVDSLGVRATCLGQIIMTLILRCSMTRIRLRPLTVRDIRNC